MKKRNYVCGILTIILLLCLGSFFFLKHLPDKAEAENGYELTKIPDKNWDKKLGTAENPFVILEIVPYEGYGEIGYMIDGCEPVDMDKVVMDGDAMGLIASTKGITRLGTDGTNQYRFADELDEPDGWKKLDGEKQIHGYYELVEENEGFFIQKEIENEGEQQIIFEYAGKGKGNVIWESADTELETEPVRLFQGIGDRICTVRKGSAADCYYRTIYSYKHNNYFIRNVLGIRNEDKIKDYKIIVKTIKASDLTGNSLNWIEQADLISISPKTHVNDLEKVWEKYNLAGKPAESNPKKNFGGCDLSWTAVRRIFDKVMTAEHYAGIMIDWDVYKNPPSTDNKAGIVTRLIDYNGDLSGYSKKEAGNKNNVYKLAMMLRIMDPVVFSNLYLPWINSNGQFTRQSGSDAQRYWTKYTFMPTKEDGSDCWDWSYLWDRMKIEINFGDPAGVSVDGRVYTYNGDSSLTQLFIEEGHIKDSAYTSDLKKFISNNEGDPDRKWDPATAVKCILNCKNSGFLNGDIKVLDLEPCADFTVEERYLRMFMPRLNGSIEIERQSTATFVGKIEDINSEYDLIYMGLNCGKFNTRKINGEDLPDYNDNALDGKVYLHVGDQIEGKNWGGDFSIIWLRNQTTARMPGNDITQAKKKQLDAYLKAGYPVLAVEDLYEKDTLKLDSSSNIYKFFIDNRKDDKYPNLVSVTSGGNQVEESLPVHKPVIQFKSEGDKPVEYRGNEVGGVIADSNYINNVNAGISNRRFNFKFTIDDGGLNEVYGAKLYVDINADGRFSESEMIRDSDGNIVGNGTDECKLYKTLSQDRVGVLPWQIEVYRKNNEHIRSVVRGVSAIKLATETKPKIKILQVYMQNGATLLLKDNPVFKTYTNSLNDFKIDFQMMSTTEFEGLFTNWNRFDKSSEARKAATDRLVNNYDMIIFGFGDMYDNISNAYGALDNVIYYIDQGRSVLFTHDVTSFLNDGTPNNKRNYGYNFNVYFRNILGMDRFGARLSYQEDKSYKRDTATAPNGGTYADIHGYTYGALKCIAGAGSNRSQKVTYKGVYPDSAMGDDWTKKVTRLNEGQITQYPYQIGEKITVARTHDQYYQLNMEDEDIVVWYCLAEDLGNNSKSSLYGVSPNDATNNYYIYNKGNVTYSGVGHSSVADGFSSASIDEVKLFVNTMVAAYKNSIKPPTVSLLDRDAVMVSNSEYYCFVYSDFLDKDISSGKINTEYAKDEMDVSFTVNDVNLQSQDMLVLIRPYTLKPDGTKEYHEFEPGVDSLDVYTAGGAKVEATGTNELFPGETFVKIVSDRNYTFRYKSSYFQDEKNRNIEIVAVNRENKKEAYVGRTTVKFVDRTLFDLD